MWSPCRWVMKMRVSWLTLSSLRRNWCWVPSPQSNSQSSARWGKRRAMLETLRDRVGTPELVPRNVICKSQITSIKVKKYVTYIQSAANPTLAEILTDRNWHQSLFLFLIYSLKSFLTRAESAKPNSNVFFLLFPCFFPWRTISKLKICT